jgi:hypothetical protein
MAVTRPSGCERLAANRDTVRGLEYLQTPDPEQLAIKVK